MRQLKISKSITNRNAASLDKYLQDISKIPMISADEEIILTQKIRTGDQMALEKLASANLRFVVSVAKQYQNQGISLSDLINEGNLGLIKAASRFDETRGFKFISYAVWWIRQAIIQAISDQSRIIRLPLNKIGSLNKIRKAQGSLEQQLERRPSNFEIAEMLEMTENEVNVAENASGWHISTDAMLPGSEDSTILEIVSDPDNDKPDDALMLSSLQAEVQRFLSKLSERERDVVILYYGIGNNTGLSLNQIGEKYELTRERVRQIKDKAVTKLKHSLKNKNIRTFLDY
ncbi:MAG: RNA polymerase sigma factor RpoD/SigA [Bacteroidia bacterium]